MYTIHVNKNLVYVSPVPAGLTELLVYNLNVRKTVRVPNNYGGFDLKTKYLTEKHKLYSLVGPNTIVVFGGLLHRIEDFMKAAELDYVVKGEHPQLPRPDLSVLKGIKLRDGQPEAIAAIAAHPRGIIKAPTGLGKTWLCGMISHIWHSANILMVASLKSVCEGLSRECMKYSPEEEVLRHFGKYLQQKGETRKENPRVVISSVASMDRIPVNWPDLILFDEAHTAPARSSMKALMQHTKPRIFGLTASPEGRSDGADDLTVALFGPLIVDITTQDGVASGAITQLKVIFVEPDIPEISYGKDTEKEPLGYWHNDERSKAIAEKAHDVMPPGSSILHYTKVVEHALRIRKLYLPDVPIAHAGISVNKWNKFKKLGLVTDAEKAELMRPDVKALEEQFRNGELKEIICTPVWKQGLTKALLRGNSKANTLLIAGNSRRHSDHNGIRKDVRDGLRMLCYETISSKHPHISTLYSMYYVLYCITTYIMQTYRRKSYNV